MEVNIARLSSQSNRVLFAVIAEYVTTGRPVSSAVVAAKRGLGMSPATVRRKMQELTENGMLVQPHTSAGRIPTDHAFRLFVDTLSENHGRLDGGTKRAITEGMSRLNPGEHQSWQSVVRLLSSVSDKVALVLTPAFCDSVLRQLRFVPCGPKTLLAVLVTREGLVHNSYVETEGALEERELTRIHNYLGRLIEGKSLNDVRALLREEVEDARRQRDALREKASILGAAAVEASVERTSELVVDGRSHLVGHPELKGRFEELIEFLEEKSRILELLDRAAKTSDEPVVIIGHEGGKSFEGCAMVTAPFGGGGEGRVGILGSIRMDYSAAISLVAMSARFLSRMINLDDGKQR